MPRIVIDITSLARWRGPPVGIPRCQQRYARYAAAHLPEAVFTIFDPRDKTFRVLPEPWARRMLEGRARLDMTMMPDPSGQAPRSIDKIPAPLREPFWWLTKTRRKIIAALERQRLHGASGRARAWAERLQERITPESRRGLFFGPDGTRIDWPSIDSLGAAPLVLEEGDTTIAMQYDWLDTDIRVLAALRDGSGSRHVVLCHDIIPLLSPGWYTPADHAMFKAYWDRAFAIADRVIFTSRHTAGEAGRYCALEGIQLAPHTIVPMGADALPAPPPGARLPFDLESGKFVLFVSTIEPRKNHRLLIEAWRRLAADGTLQTTGFKLVFVGRKGWMTEHVLSDIAADPVLRRTILHLAEVGDPELTLLYRDAAFCVYPPKTEGFGLPPVEALAAGKALMVSDAGPMPEIVGRFALALDPDDLELWTGKLREWIGGSQERCRYEAKSRSEYRPVSWETSARDFFEACLSR